MRPTRFHRSLRFKMISALVAILVLSTVVFYYLQATYHRRQLINNLEESSTHYLSNVIKSSLRHAMLRRDLEETRNIMRAVNEQREIEDIFLVNKRGEVMVSTDGIGNKRLFALSEPKCMICHQIEHKNRPRTALFTDKKGQEIIRNVYPIPNEPECHGCHDSTSRVVGALITDFSLSGVEKQLGSEFRQSAVLLAFFLVMVVGSLSFSVDRFVLARLQRFVGATKSFGRGDFSQDVPVESMDEIGELASAFNQMTADLREYIAERERAEDEVRRSWEYLHTITNSVHDGLVVIEKDYSISFVNEAYARQTGLEMKDVVQQPCYKVAHHREERCQPPEHECPLDPVFKEKRPHVTVHRHYDIEGNTRWVEVSGSPMFDEHGEVIRAVEVTRDITERKQAEEELRNTYKELRKAYTTLDRAKATAINAEKMAAVGRLTAGVSHEILNPLNIITLRLHIMLNDKNTPSEIHEDLRDLQTQSDRITKIAQDLLSFARQRPPERRHLDFNKTVMKTLSLMKPELRLSNIAVDVEFAEGLPEILADEDQLHQVVFNLLSNARDAMPEGGRLVLTTKEVQPEASENGKVVEFVVEDTGDGIEPEDMDNLFDPFFTTKPEGKGTGLGLSICQGIVEAHGGIIKAESEVGKGSTFTIQLPLDNCEHSSSI